jgi:hypothetical protein
VIVLGILLGIAENLDKIIALLSGGAGTALITAFIAWLRGRRLRNSAATLEESVRKELWNEIANLRNALREVNSTILEWQSKYLQLLTPHQKLAEDLVQSQKNFVRLAGLMNQALDALDRIEEIERHIVAPDLDAAKAEIYAIKKETLNIKKQATILYQI